MKEQGRKCLHAILIGITLSLPLIAKSTGHIIIYAVDTGPSDTPPPSTTLTLDGNTPLSFGTNQYLFLANVDSGAHTVAVETTTSGYLPRQSPYDPEGVSNPDSDYGNPRHITVVDDETIPVTFRFDPTITVSGTLRDAWTMERIEGADIEFIFEGTGGDVSVTKYPETATYAIEWKTQADGSFPTNSILYLDDYDAQFSRAGYQTLSLSNAITNAQAGDTIDLAELFIDPIDENTNQISDAWETTYFGEGSCVDGEADTDGDTICNRSEYIAGTDPTNNCCVLILSHYAYPQSSTTERQK